MVTRGVGLMGKYPDKDKTVKLTNKAIRGFKHIGGWDVRWDTVFTGLGLRVYPSEKKSFVLSYRHRGRKRLMVLGAFGQGMTIEQARTDAGERQRVLRKGDDPLEVKRRAERGSSIKDLIDAYLEQHSKPNKKTWKDDERRLDQHIPSNWRSRGVENITKADVTRLYTEIRGKTPYEANRLLSLLLHMFGWAKGQSPSYISREAIRDGWENPAVLPKEAKFKEQKRKRYARPDELPLLAKAIDAESNVYVRAGIWLYLLTGVRKAELLNVKRDQDIDWQRGILFLPDTKAGETQTVPLSAAALAIMQAAPALEGNPYLLPGAKKKRPLVNISKPWKRIRDRASVNLWRDDPMVGPVIERLSKKLERAPTAKEVEKAVNKKGATLPPGLRDLRLHDLRRTVGSWMSQDNVDLNKIKDALRHADIATTLTYARLGDDAARDAMEEHGRRIMKAAGKDKPLKVSDGSAA